jgi:thioredoxin-dependent peroxiredoxin
MGAVRAHAQQRNRRLDAFPDSASPADLPMDLAGMGGRIAVGLTGDRFGAKRVLVSGLLRAFFMHQFLYGLKPPGITAVSMLGPVVRKGDVVTDFKLPDETGAPRRLSGLLADGPVVLFFYPAAMSLGCTVESCHFRDLIAEFKAVGAQPVGISADRVERQRHFAEKHSLGYPLLSDSDQVVARQFGVRGWIPMMTLQRVTFVIDADLTVLEVISSELVMTVHADRALEVLRKRQR